MREALFQLAREGLLEPLERGYGLQEMPMSSVLARLEIGSPEHIQHLVALANEARSMLTADQSPFALASAVHGFQKSLGGMCVNPVLARCYLVAEDDFLAARPLLFRASRNRLITSDYLKVLVQEMEAGNASAAEVLTRSFISKLSNSCQEAVSYLEDCPLSVAQGVASASPDG